MFARIIDSESAREFYARMSSIASIPTVKVTRATISNPNEIDPMVKSPVHTDVLPQDDRPARSYSHLSFVVGAVSGSELGTFTGPVVKSSDRNGSETVEAVELIEEWESRFAADELDYGQCWYEETTVKGSHRAFGPDATAAQLAWSQGEPNRGMPAWESIIRSMSKTEARQALPVIAREYNAESRAYRDGNGDMRTVLTLRKMVKMLDQRQGFADRPEDGASMVVETHLPDGTLTDKELKRQAWHEACHAHRAGTVKGKMTV